MRAKTAAPSAPAPGRRRWWSLSRVVALVCFVLVLVRLSYMAQPLRFDESGYLFVARQWDGDGPFIYGDYWLDRPPGLLVLFKVAALFESDEAIRALSIPFAVLFVVAAARSAWILTGTTAARVVTVIAAALVATPVTGADQADGPVFAASLVVAAIALFLDALHRGGSVRSFWCGFGAGSLAATAPLVKQNFVEALVFGVVVLGVTAWGHPGLRQRALRTGGGALLGAMIPIAAVLVWTYVAWFDLDQLGYELVGFRADALHTIVDQPAAAPIRRGRELLLLATITGILPVLVPALLLVRWGRSPRTVRSPEGWAMVAVVSVSLVGVVGGGSYWPDYLLQLAPATVLGAALLAAHPVGQRWLQTVCVVAVATAAVSSTAMAISYATSPAGWGSQLTGEWLQASSAPGDTAVVVYGGAAIQQSAGLQSPYPYLWSLPLRVLDPDLDRLEATLRGPAAPTWIVQRSGFNSWGIDEDRELRDQVEASYRVVAEVCGKQVWLRRGVNRHLAPLPEC